MTTKKGLIIGLSGAQGSFSEEAARFYCLKHTISDAELKYLVSVEGVLSALTREDIDKGIFPIENSNGGIVYEAVHAMAKHTFTVEEFFDIDVRHNLLVRPGVKREEVSLITSHDQALKQCRMYLKKHWPEVHIEEYSDTAQAAKDLGEGKLPKTAAVIAPMTAAKLYKLDALEESIQDLKFNFTTFLAVSERKGE